MGADCSGRPRPQPLRRDMGRHLDPVYRLEIPDLDNAFYSVERTGTIDVGRGYFEDVLPKVLEIAAKLGAVVQGDEGEFYRIDESGREIKSDRPRGDVS